MFKLAHFLKAYKKQVILGPAFKLLEAIFELIIPTLMAFIIDIGVKNGDTAYILKMGGIMLLIAILGMICAFLCQYYAAMVSQGFGTAVRNSIFAHIGTFSHAELDRFGTSSLTNRITNDVNQLQFAVAMLIRLVIRAPFLCIGGLVMAMLLDMKLSLVMLFVLPLFVLVLGFIMYKSVPLYRTVQQKLDQVALVLRENLSGVRVIRAFARVENEKNRFERINTDYADTAIKVGNIAALMNPATLVIMNFSILAILWFGGIRVNAGGMTQGQVIAYINYIMQILSALMVVANLVVTFTRASASAIRVNEIFDTKSSVVDPLDDPDPAGIGHGEDAPAIEFREVSFLYGRSSEYAVKDISFTVERGQTIGIIGGTGAGKSTLVSLIPRFYDATEGSVLVNGMDVRNHAQNSLRSKIGIVPQKAVLFSGTIAENIRWGLEKATDEQIRKAAETAQAVNFIDTLPDGYDTRISRDGTNLSGGQKQRLTIARALVRQPEILILDDSSSALDYATDAALRRALHQETGEMAVIIVSQRAGAVRDADRILVLEDGEVVGSGTHEVLINTCNIYREICLSQFEKEEV